MKRSSTFLRKKVHTPEKILATPMKFLTPGKNPAGARVLKAALRLQLRLACTVLLVLRHGQF